MYLDNAVYHALQTQHAPLNIGDSDIAYFNADVAPFIGMNDWSEAGQEKLKSLPKERRFFIMKVKEEVLAAHLESVLSLPLTQMVCHQLKVPKPIEASIVELGDADVEEMIELTSLTKPGPFYKNTIKMGRYYGIREEGKLVAISGERLSLPDATEISAVCTHPNALGKGYGAALVYNVAKQIEADGKLPFLHVRKDNDRAIALYERLGFTHRSDVYFEIFKTKAE